LDSVQHRASPERSIPDQHASLHDESGALHSRVRGSLGGGALVFANLKCIYRIEHMPSGNKHITETLYAAVLTLLLSRRLSPPLVRRCTAPPARFPFARWSRLFATVASDLLDLVLSRHDRHHRQQRIERLLRFESPDPNRARIPLAFRAQQGLYQ